MVTPSQTSSTNNPQDAGNSNARVQKLLGEILVEEGWITEPDVMEALSESKKSGQYLGTVLVKRGKITKEQLGKALAKQFNIQYISLGTLDIDKSLLKILPEEFMRENQVLPIAKDGGKLVVAMVDPRNRRVVDEITFITGMRPQPLVTTSLEFTEAVNKLVQEGSLSVIEKLDIMNAAQQEAKATEGGGDPDKFQMEFDDLVGERRQDISETSSFLIKQINNTQEESREDRIRAQQMQEMFDTSNPLVKLVNSIIEEGIEKGASDVHIEPREGGCFIRFRMDGILKSILEIPANMESSFMTRIKVMSRMDIAEHRRPQDGRIGMNYKGTDYNLRVNTLPLGEGKEKIVMRILRPSKNITDFADLGFTPTDIKKLEALYQSPYGIVLVCGPTGSGKTTTLYTVLHKINEETRNISTVEDPIELRIAGLNQSQVNAKAEFTFSIALRALLRQDPDVIMIGEIRDIETLEAGIHASLTGHLVFSTIHANSTAATVTRLVEMGADPTMICSALLGVVAQRLARTICKECRAGYQATAEEKALIFPKSPEQQQKPLTLYKGAGCPRCNDTGYAGRAGLYEVMMMDRRIRQMVSAHKLDVDIEDAAVAGGMKTLYISGLELLLKGKTTVVELIRILGPNLGRTV